MKKPLIFSGIFISDLFIIINWYARLNQIIVHGSTNNLPLSCIPGQNSGKAELRVGPKEAQKLKHSSEPGPT
jgi:hypothetical protein